MKIATFIVTVMVMLFGWLAASYFRPVPHTTYEHGESEIFVNASAAGLPDSSQAGVSPLSQ